VGLGSDLLPHGVKIGKRVLPHGAKSTPPAISVSESLHHGAKRTHPATSVSESLHHGAKEVGPHYQQASLCTMGQRRSTTPTTSKRVFAPWGKSGLTLLIGKRQRGGTSHYLHSKRLLHYRARAYYTLVTPLCVCLVNILIHDVT